MRGLVSDADLGFGDRAIPAAGAAVLVNLLDVAEVCNHLRPNAVHIKTNFCLQDPRAFCRNFLGFPLFSTSLLAHAPGVPYNLSQQHAVSRGSNSLYSKEKRKKKNHYLIGTFGCYSIVQPGWNPCFRVILSSWLFLVQSNTRCIQQGRRQVGIYLPCYDVLCNWLKG
ncbi:uncharacterized protein [Elaeis guineensis]|uniref:uncharacterized protein isoform X1 n=1 Tax=Elaeis guineensis var. tenera TaxID=51953 RepID=UPI003C6DB0AE